MSRGKQANKIQRSPDPIYKSKVISKVVNMVMLDGKKSIAKTIINSMMDGLSEDKKESRKLFEDAVKNVMPNVEVRGKRIGGANYQIPVPLKHDRAETLALRWIIQVARNKKGKPMWEKLMDEIKLACNKEGGAMKKRIDTHRMADANKAFSHFKW